MGNVINREPESTDRRSDNNLKESLNQKSRVSMNKKLFSRSKSLKASNCNYHVP